MRLRGRKMDHGILSGKNRKSWGGQNIATHITLPPPTTATHISLHFPRARLHHLNRFPWHGAPGPSCRGWEPEPERQLFLRLEDMRNMIRGLGRTSIQNSRKKAPKTQTQITNSGKTWPGEWGAAGECDGRKNGQPCVPAALAASRLSQGSTHTWRSSLLCPTDTPGPWRAAGKGHGGQGAGPGGRQPHGRTRKTPMPVPPPPPPPLTERAGLWKGESPGKTTEMCHGNGFVSKGRLACYCSSLNPKPRERLLKRSWKCFYNLFKAWPNEEFEYFLVLD